MQAKPFLKWAGGKTWLQPILASKLPKEVLNGQEVTYVEPFVGAGATLFYLLQTYPTITRGVINDINPDLINLYIHIKYQPLGLIDALESLAKMYLRMDTMEKKSRYYYDCRKAYNEQDMSKRLRAALFLFLNKTCFNGLYRVNSRGHFNVPFGKYEKPVICDADNLIACHKLLLRVSIYNGDFSTPPLPANSFVYLDPPYKPLSQTANFNQYSHESFTDSEQIRLKQFVDKLTINHIPCLLSNSATEDQFFDDLYKDYTIERVKSKRRINANGSDRGEIDELIIRNY